MIELIVVIAIIATLVAVGTTVSGRMKAAAEETTCTSNMRSLHVGFAAYINDNGEWPQVPEDIFNEGDQERSWEFWVESLEPYEIAQKTWLCPTEWNQHVSVLDEDEYPEYWSSYAPTPFEGGGSIPFKWSNQPWIAEKGNYHGNGVKLMMPNGNIRTSAFLQN